MLLQRQIHPTNVEVVAFASSLSLPLTYRVISAFAFYLASANFLLLLALGSLFRVFSQSVLALVILSMVAVVISHKLRTSALPVARRLRGLCSVALRSPFSFRPLTIAASVSGAVLAILAGQPTTDSYPSLPAFQIWSILLVAYAGYLLIPIWWSANETFALTSSTVEGALIPQTIGKVVISLPPLVVNDGLMFLARSPAHYRLLSRQSNATHDLATGSLYVFNPLLAFNNQRIDNKLPLPTVDSSLVRVEAYLDFNLASGGPEDSSLSVTGVDKVIAKLFARSLVQSKLHSMLYEATVKCTAKAAQAAATAKSKLSRSLHSHVNERVRTATTAKTIDISAVGAINSVLLASEEVYKSLTPTCELWEQIEAWRTTQYTELRDSIRREFHNRLVEEMLGSMTSPDDVATARRMLGLCGMTLMFRSVSWSAGALEVKALVESVPEKWSQQVLEIESKERESLTAIVNGWLQNPAALIPFIDRPLPDILRELWHIRTTGDVREMVAGVQQMLGGTSSSRERTTINAEPDYPETA